MSQRFANTINNDPIYAARAEADQDGVNIKTYYAKIADLAAVAFSGSYNDLTNTPTIPTTDQAYDASSTNPQSGTAVAGALATVNQVPASTSSDEGKVLTVDSLGVPSWAVVPSQSTGLFEAVYGTTAYADIVQAIADKKIVYCRVSSSNTTRMAFLAYIGPSNTGNIEFQYYRSNTNGDDSVFVYACTSASVWSTAERSAGIKTQVKSDWNATSGAAQILNKPDMSLYALISSLSTVATSGSYLDLTDLPTISNVPAVTSTDDGKVLKASYSGGTGSYSWETAPSGLPASTSADEGKVLKVDANGDPEWDTAPASQVQADWTESDTTDPSYIQNKPTEQALVAGQGITITEANNQVTIGCNVQAPVQDVTYGGSSVVNAQGVAEIPAPSYPVTDVTMDGTSVLNNGVAALTSEVEILAYGSTGAWAKFTAAIAAGKSVFCRVNPSGNNYRFVALSYYNVSEGTAEFNFHRANPTKNYTTQNDELFVYSLSSSGTWATATKSVGIKSLAGVGLDKTVVDNTSITFFVKPKTNGGIGADSNGVYVEVPVPAVGSTDNGKVLKATYSGSTGSISWSEETDNVLIFSPSNDAAADAAALTAAITAGKHVELRVIDGNYTYDLPLRFWRNTEVFKFAGWVDSYREFMKVLEYTNNTWTWNATLKKTIVPNYGSGDAGKVLKVGSSGSPEWSKEETTLFTSTSGVVVGGTMTLSESIDNFPYIALINGKGQVYVLDVYFLRLSAGRATPCFQYTGNASNSDEEIITASIEFNTAGTAASYVWNNDLRVGSSGTLSRANNVTNATSKIYKIVGLTRP